MKYLETVAQMHRFAVLDISDITEKGATMSNTVFVGHYLYVELLIGV